MNIDIRSEGVHNINGVVGLKLPRSGLERVWKVVESSDRAKIDDVSRELVSHHAFDISRDLIDCSSSNLTKGEFTCNLFSESNTSSAMNASSH